MNQFINSFMCLVFLCYGTIECSAAAPSFTLPSIKCSAKKPTHHHAKALGAFSLANLDTPRAQSTKKNKFQLLMHQFKTEVAHFNKLAGEKCVDKPLLRKQLQKIDDLRKQFSATELDFNPKIKMNFNAAKSKLHLLESNMHAAKQQRPSTAAAQSKTQPIKASCNSDKKKKQEEWNEPALNHLKTVFLHCMKANFIQHADPERNIQALFKSQSILDANLASMQKALEGMKFLDKEVATKYYWVLESHKHSIKESQKKPL